MNFFLSFTYVNLGTEKASITLKTASLLKKIRRKKKNMYKVNAAGMK